MARAKVSLAEIDRALHQELTQRLGYDAKDHMVRVNYMSTGGEPNWNANFASQSPAPLPVWNAFIEALRTSRRCTMLTTTITLSCFGSNGLERRQLATRQERIDDFVHDETPPTYEALQVLCEDHNGTYVLPFLRRWRDGVWQNAKTSRLIEAAVIGWRAPGQAQR